MPLLASPAVHAPDGTAGQASSGTRHGHHNHQVPAMSIDDSQHWQTWVQRLEQGDTQVVPRLLGVLRPAASGVGGAVSPQQLPGREEPEDVVHRCAGRFSAGPAKGSSRSPTATACGGCSARSPWQRAARRRDSTARCGGRWTASGNCRWRPTTRATKPRRLRREPSPAEQAEFCEQLERLLESLDEEERRLLELRLAEHTHEEAAEKMGCSERTVRRIQKRLQHRLSQMLQEPEEDADD